MNYDDMKRYQIKSSRYNGNLIYYREVLAENESDAAEHARQLEIAEKNNNPFEIVEVQQIKK